MRCFPRAAGSEKSMIHVRWSTFSARSADAHASYILKADARWHCAEQCTITTTIWLLSSFVTTLRLNSVFNLSQGLHLLRVSVFPHLPTTGPYLQLPGLYLQTSCGAARAQSHIKLSRRYRTVSASRISERLELWHLTV